MTADRDPPPRDTLRSSGPADVPVALLTAAQRGDPGAFASVVEHWEADLRRFVHVVLAGTGSTERVLSATYVSAYRALPRYRPDRTPGLWLHRLAYLAAGDEVRRLTREPLRAHRSAGRTPRRAGTPEAAEPGQPVDPTDAAGPALRRLALDQRALLVLVEIEGYRCQAVADAFDLDPTVAEARLAGARAVLDPQLVLTQAVPPVSERFWTDLGRRLLAERERPAAPSIDPASRLARAHPSAPGFRPATTTADPRSSIASLADRADRQRPPRRWRRALVIAGAVAALFGVVAAAVAIGLSGRAPDGSVTGRELAVNVANALTGSRYLRVDVEVDEPGSVGGPTTTAHRLTLADDGSWSVLRTDAIDLAAFEAGAGVGRRAAVVDSAPGSASTVLSAVTKGLAAGPPDPSVEPVPWLSDLEAVGILLRGDGDRRAPATEGSVGRSWTYTRTVGTGLDGTPESWSVEVRRSDDTPARIERRRGDTLVRRVRFGRWAPLAEVPDDTFSPRPPAGAPTTDHGFRPVDLPGVELLGRGQAITPSWLPAGFALGGAFIRDRPPAGAVSTGGGINPPDRAVTSLAYQRGPERITVTTRSRGGPEASWASPFDSSASVGEAASRTLGDGRFNQVRVRITTDALGRAQLWGLTGDVVFTVAGDVTVAEGLRLASSLR